MRVRADVKHDYTFEWEIERLIQEMIEKQVSQLDRVHMMKITVEDENDQKIYEGEIRAHITVDLYGELSEIFEAIEKLKEEEEKDDEE